MSVSASFVLQLGHARHVLGWTCFSSAPGGLPSAFWPSRWRKNHSVRPPPASYVTETPSGRFRASNYPSYAGSSERRRYLL